MEILSDHLLGPSAAVDWMPSAAICKNPPSWYVHINNSNLVIADDSSSFLIDCGTKSAFERLVKLRQSGRIKSIDGIFITHYHDDHTNFINNVVKEFNCPVYVTRELKDILENPAGFHMPCLTTDPITDLNIMQNGQQMHWKNFTLTFLFYPGQTLYHDALLFEKQNGETIFFIGDSFTPYGIDDYCLLNRNLLHPGTGYFYCLDILKKLPENIFLANQHVEPLFSFSYPQLDHMKGLLLERNYILQDLLPWDNINYGVDEQWVNIYPYSQKTKPGRTIEYSVNVVNHSDVVKTFTLEPELPEGFIIEPEIASQIIEPQVEGTQIFKIKIPAQALHGISLLTFSIKFDKWDLQKWSEAIIEIE
jgi:glyoxylase-like metal-dependent hydrolase (beta-lactamase superfamily II)